MFLSVIPETSKRKFLIGPLIPIVPFFCHTLHFVFRTESALPLLTTIYHFCAGGERVNSVLPYPLLHLLYTTFTMVYPKVSELSP
jgi:uncharacterized membrane protein (GlpM family)